MEQSDWVCYRQPNKNLHCFEQIRTKEMYCFKTQIGFLRTVTKICKNYDIKIPKSEVESFFNQLMYSVRKNFDHINM